MMPGMEAHVRRLRCEGKFPPRTAQVQAVPLALGLWLGLGLGLGLVSELGSWLGLG
jgi:hypothetical protein